MGLKERINSKSRELVQRKSITLPKAGEVVVVRSLMSGHILRVKDAPTEEMKTALTVALGTEDPETGRPIWMAHSQEDIDEIGAMDGRDLTAICEGIFEVTGGDEKSTSLGNLEGTGSSSISSPSATE